MLTAKYVRSVAVENGPTVVTEGRYLLPFVDLLLNATAYSH